MTVREMHIEIGQSLQKVAANKTRKFLSEEVDWVLNKIQDRFIQQALRPIPEQPQKYRFADQIRQDMLRYITVTGKTLEAIRKDDVSVQCFLPHDYQFLLSDVSQMANLCNGTIARTEADEFRYYNTLKLSKSNLPSGPYYVSNNSIQVGPVLLNIPGDLGDFNSYAGFNRKEDVTFLKDWILTKLWKAGVEIYWEKYGPFYHQNCFIVPGDLPIPFTLRWDDTDVSIVDSIRYKATVQSAEIAATISTDNRLLTSYDVSNTYTPYYASNIKSPVSELSSNVLSVYQDNSCTVRAVKISYVRKAQIISLSLGSDCELAEPFHQTICDLSVEYLKGVMEDKEGSLLKKQDIETRVHI